MPAGSGRYPSGQRGQTVNLLAYAFGGSNPPLPTIVTSAARPARVAGGPSEVRVAPIRATTVGVRATTVRVRATGDGCRGNSSAVERQPSKLGVAGSNPVSRSKSDRAPARLCRAGCERMGVWGPFRHPHVDRAAHVAQLAEHALGKGEVSGSIPDMGSTLSRIRR